MLFVLNVGCKKTNDTTPPIILLKGLNPLILNLNVAYTEPGAIANDNVDGDISSQIVITGAANVNSNLKGIYYVTYTVKDAAGNLSTTKRQVIVGNIADSLAGNYNVLDTCFGAGPGNFTSWIKVSDTINGLMKIFNFIIPGDSVIANLASNDSTITFPSSQYLGSGDSLVSATGLMTLVDTAFNGSPPIRNIKISYKWYNGAVVDSCTANYFHQ